MLLRLEDPAAAPPRGWALWALGFRPLYLLAAALAALSVPLWALQASGFPPHAYLRGPAWHAHEMLFGFALAVIVGFLFTAGRNWSNQPTPTGGALMAIAALWLAARVLVLSPWPLAAALANVAFPLAAAWGFGRAIVAAGNRRNYFFIGLLAAMALAAAVFHAVQMGAIALPGSLGLTVGLDIVLVIMAVMGGRVIPMFTNNGVPGAGARVHRGVERAAIGTVAALAVANAGLGLAGGDAPWLTGTLALAAAAAHAVRWSLWRPWNTRRVPLVWVLHLAYAWIWLHLLLRAAAAASLVPASAATHALTVGAIGGLTIGMMTRTARGHTARPLRADRADVAAYALVALAALVRVGLPLAWPTLQVPAVLASAALWSAGFAVYVWHYGPWLARPRLDGRPG
jgi:uncharacterized protein involved in response to NO